MYPYIAGWFARSPQLKKGDFTFVKKIGIGGSVLDTTTVELVENCIPGVIHDQVKINSESNMQNMQKNYYFQGLCFFRVPGCFKNSKWKN